MQIKPILFALWHHKAGTALIVLQVALTLAIVCNALFIIQQRVARLSRPSGVDEAHVLVIQNQWVGSPTDTQMSAMTQADLNTLRNVPGVANAFASNAHSLGNSGWSKGLRYSIDQKTPTTSSALYFADEQAISTLGLKLIAGRNFRSDEIRPLSVRDTMAPSAIIITKALADTLYPDGTAVGKSISVGTAPPSTIIGVVDRLQTWIGSFTHLWIEHSTLVPYRLLAASTIYVVRAQPGQLADVARNAPKALLAANRMRVIGPKDVLTYDELRAATYKTDRGMAILMGVICIVLLAATTAGIVGLTSFWVSQRRKQIGVRRALGATRGDILSYFCTENLLITLGGVFIGALLAVGLNLLMIDRFEMARLSLAYVAICAVAFLLLGQSAVLAPALRASRLSPVEATRSV